MSDVKNITREDRAKQLVRRSISLLKLIRLNAPEFIIEGARMNLAKTVIAFPAMEDQILLREQGEREVQQQEWDALAAAGYFDEIDGPIAEDGHDWQGFIGGCERFGCGHNCSAEKPGGDK